MEIPTKKKYYKEPVLKQDSHDQYTIGQNSKVTLGFICLLFAGGWVASQAVSDANSRIATQSQQIIDLAKTQVSTQAELMSFKQTYIGHTRLMDDSVGQINADLGYLKGGMQILIQQADTK